MFKNVKIRTRLLVCLLSVGIIPFSTIGIISLYKSSGVISSQAFEKLMIVQEIKKAQVEEYFQKTKNDIKILSTNPVVKEAMDKFAISFNTDGSIQDEAYDYFDEIYGRSFGEFVTGYAFYDILLITKEGKVVYSFLRESDLGQNVIEGDLKESPLGKIFSEGLNGTAIRDFEAYSPSGNQFISFITMPVYATNGQTQEAGSSNEVMGIIALKLKNKSLNVITQRRAGMGETGETYLVSRKDEKISYRTDWISEGEEQIKIGEETFMPFLKEVFAGKSGSEIYNNDGINQLISFSPLNIEGLKWGIYSKIDVKEAFAAINSLKWINALTALICISVILVVGFIFTKSIIGPIKDVIEKIKDIAEGEGDLTSRLEIKNRDEIGELSQWFNKFIDKLQAMIRNIAGNAETLNKASSDLSNLSGQMSEGADRMSGKANSVASASEEMSSNMDSVAAAMEEASTNVEMVAASAEEMTATINEIAQNSEKARTITGESVSQAQGVSVKVDELGRAAQEIGKVTEAISEISEQTNLLALNATIEAARAGEAGKGFAVVANEIKELASQTADATQEIKGQIDGIQNSTEGTVSEIGEILSVINDVNEIVSTIATAVEEQSVTTKEIAGNVTQASQGMQEVNENVSQSSMVSSDIAKEITEVNQSAADITNSSAQVNLSAGELNKLAGELKEMVNKFKV